MTEIVFPILESKSVSSINSAAAATAIVSQKVAIVKSLQCICSDPQVLVELYLNYDCDPEALENIYEKIVNCLSRFVSSREPRLPLIIDNDHFVHPMELNSLTILGLFAAFICV